jgi:tryptophan-rich sensory protein
MSTRDVVTSVALPVAAAVAGSVASARGTRSAWYAGLRKPPIQPPAAVFPVVWTGLYASSVAASLVAQTEMRGAEKASYQRALAVNMALNAGWCWTFFAFRRKGAAVAVAGALAASTWGLAARSGAARPAAGAALVPYAAWTTFAAVLSESIRRRNRDR